MKNKQANNQYTNDKNILGNYGNIILLSNVGSKKDEELPFSYLNPLWKNPHDYREKTLKKLGEILYFPHKPFVPEPRVKKTYTMDNLYIELLEWTLPYGPPTEAFFLKPSRHRGKLPGILLLHDHGGFKYFGKSKVVKIKDKLHPLIEEHQKKYYGGRAIANELAKQGYGVLVPDIFTFESRKLDYKLVPQFVIDRILQPPDKHEELTPEKIEQIECTGFSLDLQNEDSGIIQLYNSISQPYEDIIAKSLLSMGFCWPALILFEDTCALNYLLSRDDIDSGRIGCCGLSGGGLRTNLIGGIDERIICTVTAGFMSTWKDFASNICFTHTWMLYIPELPRMMDYPQILGLRAPSPAMVLATEKDPLFTLNEVKVASEKIREIYRKMGAPDNFCFKLFPGGHKFDKSMQETAFEWLNKFLK